MKETTMTGRLATLVIAMIILFAASVHGADAAARKGGPFGIGNEYPIVLMAVPDTDKDFQHAKEIGANYVHMYGMSNDASPAGMAGMRHYMDLAQKYGLKVMFDLDGSRRMDKGQLGLDETRRIVNAFKDHPAMGFWYLIDEPDDGDRASPAKVEKSYRIIKELAPKIPVCVLTTIGAKWNDYDSALDVYSYDTYPVGTTPFPQASIERVVDFNHWALQQGKPVMPCLQAFNYVFIDAERFVKAGTFNEPAKQKLLKELRYPTELELRYWHFATLVQGARGVIYYSYLQGIRTDLPYSYPQNGQIESYTPPKDSVEKDWRKGLHIDPHWLDDTLTPAVQELKSFTDLVGAAWEHQIIPAGRTRNILEGVWKRGGKTYVVIVNSWPLTRGVILSKQMMAPFEGGKVASWGFSRKIAPYVDKGSGLSQIQEMHPWEVLVWEVGPR